MNIEKVTENHAGFWLTAIVTIVVFTSCGTTRPYVYMQGSFDTPALS